MDAHTELEKKLKPYMEVLRATILFKGFSEQEILQVLAALSAHVSEVKKKETIVYDGDRMSELAVVLSGQVHLSHTDPNGNSNLMEVLGPSKCFGSMNAAGNYRLTTSAVVTEDARILFFSTEPLFRDTVIKHPILVRFLQNLALRLAEKAHELTRKLDDSIRRSTRERLSDYLSGEYHRTGSRTFTIPLNRQDLADFLFVDRSAMSNELCRMRDEGLIRFDKSQFELLIKMPITDKPED